MNHSESASSEKTIQRVERALASLRRGSGVLVTDHENRENEVDLIFPAPTITEQQMAMLIRECSGIVCLCLTGERVEQLKLPMMVEHNTSPYQTAFTVSIEAARGVTTGVSAADRVRTVRAAVAPGAVPEDLIRPGHVFPLKARPGGVLEREGHTEATVDLMLLAGLPPCGVLCELTHADGTMVRWAQALPFAEKHAFPMVTIDDLIRYRKDKAVALDGKP